VNLRPLSGRPGAVLPAYNVGRKNWGPWQDSGEFRRARFASDQSDDLHAPVQQELAEKSPEGGACPTHQHDDLCAYIRGKGVVRRTDRCESCGRVDQHLRPDFVRNRVRQRHHGASRNDDFVPPRAWRGEKRHSEARSQSQTGVDLGANLAHDASAFESGNPPSGADRRRRSERWRPHDS
jgi:hypothetical protein